MTYQFRPAVRQQTSLLIGLAGPSGCGKTFSALRLATGLAGPGGKIAFIDTEAGRALHYADKFKFDHCGISPPFRPDNYRDAIVTAEDLGYDVIVVDSMSHEYEGTDGVKEWAEELERGGVKSPGNWNVPKTSHKRMMNRLLQCRPHLIFCLRAEEKIRIEKDDRGKTQVVPAGWQPICEKRFMYEMTASFLMLPNAPGVPEPIKLQDQHRAAFPTGEPIGEDAGAALSKWAHGGTVPISRADEDALREARDVAAKGRDAFRTWWNGPGKLKRDACRAFIDELKTTAAEADRADEPGVNDDDPFDDPPRSEPTFQAAGDLVSDPENASTASKTSDEPPASPDIPDDGDSSADDWAIVANEMIERIAEATSAKHLDTALASPRFADLARMETAAPQQHRAVAGFIEEKRKELAK